MADKPFIKQFWHSLYIELLSNPNDHRTDKQFCEETKIHTNTLCVWKREYRLLIYAEAQKRRQAYLNELRATAWKALASKMDKDTNAIKLAFQLTGDLVERSESRIEHLSQTDKINRINSLLKEASERTKAWKKVEETEPGTKAPETDLGVSNDQLGNESRENPDKSGNV